MPTDPQGALKLLEEATTGNKAQPSTLLHLAAAYQQHNRPDDAREALQRARDAGLKESALSDDERKTLAKLASLKP